MSNELIGTDNEQTPYPGIRKVVEKTLPRFAVEGGPVEPQEDEEFEEGELNKIYPELLEPIRAPITAVQYFPAPGTSVEEELDPGSVARGESVRVSLFNEAGLLVERTHHEEGILTQRERWTYTDSGQIERRVTEDLVNENLEREERSYDAEGRIKRRVVSYADHSEVVTDYLWRNEGREQEEVTRSDDGIESHFVRHYDDGQNLIEETEINPETGERLTEYTTYDSNGHILEIGHILEGERVPLLQYTYDDAGNEIEQMHLAESGQVISATVSTFANGDCVEEQITMNGEAELRTNTYDAQHKLLHAISKSGASESETVIAYDESGRKSVEATRRMYGLNSTRYTPDIRSSTTWYEYFSEAD